jgi:hypothetical protein
MFSLEEQFQKLKEPEDEKDSESQENSMPQITIESDPQEEPPIHFSWEKEYFSGFDWLNHDTERHIVAEYLEDYIHHLEMKVDNETLSRGLYFISLENNKMFLYDSEEKSDDEIMGNCKEVYEYVQINRPIKIVFYIPNIQDDEIDENVKLFMHEFGIENTRGGSYTDIVIPDETKRRLYQEFATYPSKHDV